MPSDDEFQPESPALTQIKLQYRRKLEAERTLEPKFKVLNPTLFHHCAELAAQDKSAEEIAG